MCGSLYTCKSLGYTIKTTANYKNNYKNNNKISGRILMEALETIAPRSRLLIVDDSAVIRKAVAKLLADEFDIVSAENGKKGWEKIQKDTDIQIVFTDINMPEMDGFELLKKIRISQDEGIRNLPVVVITSADDTEKIKEDVLEVGASDFITKPFSGVGLKARARAHASYQRASQVLQEQVNVDVVTGLLNKNGFLKQLESDLSMVARHEQELAVLKIELNDAEALFGQIGKTGIDNVLKLVSKVLLQAVREEDSLSRDGHATFLLSMPMAKPESVKDLAQRICKIISSVKLKQKGKNLQISISVGICTIEAGLAASPEDVLKKAQLAVKAAAKTGKGKVSLQTLKQKAKPGVKTKENTKEKAKQSVAVSIDKVLAHLEKGNEKEVIAQIDKILLQLAPLFNLLTDAQKVEIIASAYNEQHKK